MIRVGVRMMTVLVRVIVTVVVRMLMPRIF